jgi:1-acyl-sn-glycerol-3-phosphate acyltransferase
LKILDHSYSWWLAPLLYVVIFLLLVALHIGAVIGIFALTDINSPAKKGSKFYRFLINITLPMVITLARVKINVTGLDIEELPKNQRMFFVCNHQHDFDPVILLTVFKDFKLGFIGKKDIIPEMPLVAKIIHKLNGLFIDREHDREAAKTILQAVKTIKNDEASVALFPEGYVSKDCTLLPFRNGAFKIATKTKCPIVICALNNTRSIPKNMCRKTTKVNLKIVGVLYPEQYEGLTTTEMGDRIHTLMDSALAEIKKTK